MPSATAKILLFALLQIFPPFSSSAGIGSLIGDLLEWRAGQQQVTGEGGRCQVVLLGLEASLARQVAQELSPRHQYQILHLRESEAITEQVLERLSASSWCLALVVRGFEPATHQPILEAVQNRMVVDLALDGKEVQSSPNPEVITVRSLNSSNTESNNSSSDSFVLHRSCGACPPRTDLWSLSSGFSKGRSRCSLDCCGSRSNPHLSGRTLSVGAYGAAPFVKFDFSSGGPMPRITGVDVDIVSLVADKLDFRAVFVPIRGWDYVDAQGVRQGVVGMVENHVFDASLGEWAERYGSVPMRVMAEDHIYFGPTGLVMGSNSPYASDVDWVLGHLVQGGIVNKLFRNGQSSRSLAILRESKRKSSTKILGSGGGGGSDGRAGKLGPEKYLGTFAIYLTALVLSAAVAASEVVERRTRRWKGRNISRSAAVILIKVQSVSSNYETYF